MKEKAAEFLKQFTDGKTDCTINYRVYEYGSILESLPFDTAVEKFIQDYEEIKDLLESYGLNSDKAYEGTCRIWEKHIVTF